MALFNKPKAAPAPRAHLPAQAVFVAAGRWRVDGRDAKRQYRRFFTGPTAEAAAKKHAADLNAAPKVATRPNPMASGFGNSKPAGRAHLPAVVVSVGPGKFRVDGRDSKRMYRKFFSGPNAENNAKAHAAQLNSAPRPGVAGPGPGKPGAKLGGPLAAVLAADAALKVKQANTARAKAAAEAAAAAKIPGGPFAAMHTQSAMKALEDLTSNSPSTVVAFAIRQAELAGVSQGVVEQSLRNRGFNVGRLNAVVRELQAETAKA